MFNSSVALLAAPDHQRHAAIVISVQVEILPARQADSGTKLRIRHRQGDSFPMFGSDHPLCRSHLGRCATVLERENPKNESRAKEVFHALSMVIKIEEWQ